MEENPYYSQAPQQQPYVNTHDAAPVMTTGQWIVTMLLLCIPFMNIILLIVWATSSTENPNRANYAKATLVFMGISIALGILMAIFAGGIMGSLMSMGQY